jgi:hypothetical protein
LPSQAYGTWISVGASALDQIEHAHASVGGTSRGRRYATQQINHAYAVLLSSHFQAFCRDLHSEAVDNLVRAVSPVVLQATIRAALTRERRLDHGNANPSGIGSDFKRLGLVFWDDVIALGSRNRIRQNRLDGLNVWRNAIAHQDFTNPALGGVTILRLSRIKQWRRDCHNLARCFDRVVRDHIHRMTGSSPWS